MTEVFLKGHRMPLLRTCATICLLVSVPALAAPAQSRNAPHFDPTPVEIPSVAKTAPRRVTSIDLLKIRECYGISISPDGKEIAFVAGQASYEANGFKSGLFVVSTLPRSVTVNLGSAGPPHWDSINQWIPEAPQWSRDSRYVTYRMRRNDLWQVWRWDRTGGKPVQLTHVPGNVDSYHWTGDGRNIVLTVEKVRNLSDERRLSGQGILYDGNFRPWEGTPIVREALATKPSVIEVWIHDVANGSERRTTERERKLFDPQVNDIEEKFKTRLADSSKGQQIEDAKVSPNGQMVAYRCFVEDRAHSTIVGWRLFLMRLGGGSPIELTPAAYYVREYWWSSDSDAVYYTENEGEGRADKLMAVTADRALSRQVLSTSDSLNQYSVDRTGRHLACVLENNTTPPQIAVVDGTTGDVKTLVNLNPEFKNIVLSQPSRIQGTNKYNDMWSAHLVKPLNYEPGKRYPLVIVTYRSGEDFLLGGSGNENPIQVYAAHGLAVLDFDIGRIRSRRPGDFEDRLLDWASPTASMEMAINRLSETGIIDPERVGLAGFSHGSEILEYSISHTDLFRAAVESGPAARDPYFYFMADNTWHQTFSDWGLGGWPEAKAKVNWKELASSLNANRIKTPVLMNAGDSEYIIALSLYTSLQQLQKPVELFIYPNELHVKNQPKHRYEIYERNLDWFRFWLKEEEDPDPAKVEQYRRWRELRKLQEQNEKKSANAPSRTSN